MNQCDGCARRLPVKNGLHRGVGWDVIGCTKDRYPDANAEKKELDLIDKNADENMNKQKHAIGNLSDITKHQFSDPDVVLLGGYKYKNSLSFKNKSNDVFLDKHDVIALAKQFQITSDDLEEKQ